MKYYLLLLIMTVMGSVASLFLKKASGADGLLNLIKKPSLYLGGFLYLGSAVLNIIVLQIMPYSVVLPLTSLTYIWTMFLSRWLLGEKITTKKMAGVFLIAVGAVMISL